MTCVTLHSSFYTNHAKTYFHGWEKERLGEREERLGEREKERLGERERLGEAGRERGRERLGERKSWERGIEGREWLVVRQMCFHLGSEKHPCLSNGLSKHLINVASRAANCS